MNDPIALQDAIVQLYVTNSSAIQGIVMMAVHTADITSGTVRLRAVEQVHQQQQSFRTMVRSMVSRDARQFTKTLFDAPPESLPSNQSKLLVDHFAHLIDGLDIEISALLARDRGDAQKSMKKAALTVDLMMMTRGLDLPAALTALRIEQASKNQVGHRNRANRKVLGSDFVRGLIAHFHVQLKADLTIMKIAFDGFKQFKVTNSSAFEGQVFTIADYDAVRDDIFHPQSDAQLEPV